MITDRCINCGYCEQECPNQAIYEPGMKWSISEGTTLEGTVTLYNGREVEADKMLDSISDKYYFIIPEKCAECKAVHEEPQCRVVCPDPESIIAHPEYGESDNTLRHKQTWLNH